MTEKVRHEKNISLNKQLFLTPVRGYNGVMKTGRGIRNIFRKKESGLTAAEEAKASSVAASISSRVEESYPESEIEEAEKKAAKYSSRKALKGIWDRIRVLFFIAKHPKVWGLPVAVPAAVAVLYLVLPVDAIPDIIAGAGLLDDVFVITGMISLIVKTVSSFSKEKLLEIRKECPEDILPAFDLMFSVDTSLIKKEEETVEPVVVDEKEAKVERAATGIEKGLKGAKAFVSSFHSALDEAARDNPSVRDSKLYRIVDRVDVYSDAVKTEAKKIAMRALEDALKLMLLKKGVKSLISFSLFALSLFFFSMKDDGAFYLVISSLSMLLSYGFFIHSIIKTVPKVYHFVKAYISDGLEGGVVAVFFRDTAENPTLREAAVRCGVRRIKNDTATQTLLVKNFGRTLLMFLIRLALIALSVFALKKVVLRTSGLRSSFQILFAPFVELFNLFKTGK